MDLLIDEMREVHVPKETIGVHGSKFVEYVIDNYFEGQFGQDLWNHYHTDSETTNNYVEGDNFKMNQYYGAAKPNIEKAVSLLRNCEANSYIKYFNACKESSKAPKQVRENMLRNVKFRQARQFHRDGKITTSVYHEKLLNIYKFVPKKKYAQVLKETDSEPSDATEI